MGRVITRIFSEDFKSKLPGLIGVEIDCLLADNTVYHGKLISISDKSIVVLNNVRNKKEIPVSSIKEVSFV